MISTDIGVWVAGILTLVIMSILIKPNRINTIGEHLFIGASAGFTIIQAADSMWRTGIVPMMGGRIDFIVPLVIGVFLFARFFPKYAWLSHYGLALLTGVGTGLVLLTTMHSQFIQQIRTVVAPVKATPFDVFSAIMAFVFIVFPLFFFIYTRKAGPTMSRFIKVGRYCMMIGFGAAYGSFAMSRLAFIIGRLEWILKTWFGL